MYTTSRSYPSRFGRLVVPLGFAPMLHRGCKTYQADWSRRASRRAVRIHPWGTPVRSRLPQVRGRGNTKVCVGCSRRLRRPRPTCGYDAGPAGEKLRSGRERGHKPVNNGQHVVRRSMATSTRCADPARNRIRSRLVRHLTRPVGGDGTDRDKEKLQDSALDTYSLSGKWHTYRPAVSVTDPVFGLVR
jgi:hypothetical protein